MAYRKRVYYTNTQKALDEAQQKAAKQLYDAKKHTVGELCKMFGISKPTLYNYVKG